MKTLDLTVPDGVREFVTNILKTAFPSITDVKADLYQTTGAGSRNKPYGVSICVSMQMTDHAGRASTHTRYVSSGSTDRYTTHQRAIDSMVPTAVEWLRREHLRATTERAGLLSQIDELRASVALYDASLLRYETAIAMDPAGQK